MNTIRSEKRNGYDVHVKVVQVHRGSSTMQDSRLPTAGYLPLVQICRDDEVFVEWHAPKCRRSRFLRDEAEDDALACASACDSLVCDSLVLSCRHGAIDDIQLMRHVP